MPLALMAICLSVCMEIPTGVLAAARRGNLADTTVMGVAQIGVALPNFWLGLLFILLFAVLLPWFPAGGFAGWDKGAWAAIHSLRSCLALALAALALPQAAILSRVAVYRRCWRRWARITCGRLGEGTTGVSRIVASRGAECADPVVACSACNSRCRAGTVIIENVFTLPGLGRLVFQAIAQRDLIVVQDLVVLLAGSVIVVNFFVDLAYRWTRISARWRR